MYAPARHDEITGLVHYLDEQLTAIRSAAFGLTEEQARETPCRSALSIGGILKHSVHGMRGALRRLASEPAPLDSQAFAAYTDSFTVRDDETVAAILDDFDEVRAALLTALASLDPGADAVAAPAPWHGIPDARPIHLRYDLVHLLEEFARHAGHADIVREQIDGVAVPALVLTLAGAEANDFFRPYRPAPATLLS
jgi:hypothetical protein